MITKSLPLYIQAYELIREQIIMGERKPGDKLIESKLSNELGISRGPIREALRMVEQDGLIVNSDNGLIVNPMSYEDLRNIWECRIANESYAARLATDNISESDIEQLREYVSQAVKARRENDFKLYVETNVVFHDYITRLCGNSYLIDIVEKLSSFVLYIRASEFIKYGPREGMDEEHMDIIEVIQSKDKDKIESIMREHFIRDWEYNYSLWE